MNAWLPWSYHQVFIPRVSRNNDCMRLFCYKQLLAVSLGFQGSHHKWISPSDLISCTQYTSISHMKLQCDKAVINGSHFFSTLYNGMVFQYNGTQIHKYSSCSKRYEKPPYCTEMIGIMMGQKYDWKRDRHQQTKITQPCFWGNWPRNNHTKNMVILPR